MHVYISRDGFGTVEKWPLVASLWPRWKASINFEEQYILILKRDRVVLYYYFNSGDHRDLDAEPDTGPFALYFVLYVVICEIRKLGEKKINEKCELCKTLHRLFITFNVLFRLSNYDLKHSNLRPSVFVTKSKNVCTKIIFKPLWWQIRI